MEGVSQHQFKGIMGRLKALGIKNQDELGKVLEIGQTAVSAAKRRESFPDRWTEVICEKYDITPSYLLLGREDQKFNDEFYGDDLDFVATAAGNTQNRRVDITEKEAKIGPSIEDKLIASLERTVELLEDDRENLLSENQRLRDILHRHGLTGEVEASHVRTGHEGQIHRDAGKGSHSTQGATSKKKRA